MILNDKQIKKLVEEEDMISPFVDRSVSHGISHGLNCFGVDLRCGSEFKIFTNVNSEIVDPKNFKLTSFVSKKSSECIIPPNSFVLASTV